MPNFTDETAFLNVKGEPLVSCSMDPLTGFYRDGKCATGAHDHGRHTICAKMTEEFLSFTQKQGNDLSTPRPEFQFPGLKPGDGWCLCASRWLEAYKNGVAPLVNLDATEMSTLEIVPREALFEMAVEN